MWRVFQICFYSLCFFDIGFIPHCLRSQIPHCCMCKHDNYNCKITHSVFPSNIFFSFLLTSSKPNIQKIILVVMLPKIWKLPETIVITPNKHFMFYTFYGLCTNKKFFFIFLFFCQREIYNSFSDMVTLLLVDVRVKYNVIHNIKTWCYILN